jgi:Flp pilus assembly protein TadG
MRRTQVRRSDESHCSNAAVGEFLRRHVALISWEDTLMKTKTFRSNRGAVLVIVALFVVVLLAVTGLAIDSGIGYGVKARLNAALDAAALAAAQAVSSGESDAERRAAAVDAARRYFAGNFPAGWLGATPEDIVVNAVHEPDGYWRISVAGRATVPTALMGLLGYDLMTVNAEAEAIKRDLDLVLVIDSSGSLDPPHSPPGTFSRVKEASKNFVARFSSGPGGDRLGLVAFASGAVLSVPIDKTASRGFDKVVVESAIDALTSGGSTASAEAMRIARNEIEAVPADLRSSLRVIVFFSDGAPNDVPAVFDTTVGERTGDLFSGLSGPGTNPARDLYRHDQRNSFLGAFTISELPAAGLGSLPLEGYNGRRNLAPTSPPFDNTRCNVNKAARNMVENAANDARGNGIYVYTLGLGSRLNTLEITYCGYDAEEHGANILRRLANTDGRDGNPPADTLDDDQPSGLYVFAEDADQLEEAFNRIASDILRLTR